MSANEDHSINNGRSQPVFRIFGDLFHQCGPLLPNPGHTPKYAQLYIYDPESALVERSSANTGLDRQILFELQNMLLTYNPYTAMLRYASEVFAEQDPNASTDIAAHLRITPGVHARLGNLPSADEVAVIICDSKGEQPSPKDVVIYRHGGSLQIVNDLHAAYTPLYYVLLFPRGEPGWHSQLEMFELDANNNQLHRHLLQTRYITFRLQVRASEFSTILRSKRLLQRYLVDMYSSIDQNRLSFLRFNQPKLRACLYSGLQDALSSAEGDLDLNEIGQRIVLPSSYTGGPRHMQQCYQDSMAIARHFGHCDLFITMTCNPQWIEIQREL